MKKKAMLGNHVVDAINTISTENNINKEIIFSAIEQAFVLGAEKKYGNNFNIIARCSRTDGTVSVYRLMQVVENVVNSAREVSLDDARKKNKSLNVGNFLEEEIPSSDFSRVVVQKMGSVINGAVREAKKEQEYNLFIDRVGELVYGTVKSVSPREVIVWIGGSTEAVMNIRDGLHNEKFNIDDRLNFCIQKVNKDLVNPQVVLSRKSDEFLKALLKAEIPECDDGVISIVSIAREPGFRAKIAVMSGDSRIDPVGACIGPKGARVKALMEQLKGEKIDIIEYSQDIETFIHRAITPAKAVKVIPGSGQSAEVIVDEENLSLAIGRKGQNVRLVSKLTGWKVDVMLESERQEKSAKKFKIVSDKISAALNLDEVVGQVLVANGFNSISDIINADISRIATVEGFDEDVAEIIKSRAIEYINHLNESQDSEIGKLGISPELLELPILTKEMIIILGNAGIRTTQDIADLASDELVEILGEDLIKEEDAGDLVMITRRYCYGI